MAMITEWSKEQEKEWDKWVSSRPQLIKDLCEKFPPYNLYLLKDTGQRVTLDSYSEDGTMVVHVSGEYNAVIFDRYVFGIKPDDLEECNLPEADNVIGTVLTEGKDVEEFIACMRNE